MAATQQLASPSVANHHWEVMNQYSRKIVLAI
jgi:hypothetical protein